MFDKLFEKPILTLKERATVLFDVGDLTDCEFVVGEQKVKVAAHKLFMSISSPVFYAMFYGRMAVESDKPIEISDIDVDGFQGLIEFIYTDKVEFTSALHACKVFIAARKYIVPSLETICLDYIKVHAAPKDAIELYEHSRMHCITELIDSVCVDLFKNRTNDILESDSFLQADVETIQAIVEQECLNIESEVELFRRVEKWSSEEAKRQDISVKEFAQSLSGIISLLRFLTMNVQEKVTVARCSPLLTKEQKLAVCVAHYSTPNAGEALEDAKLSKTKVLRTHPRDNPESAYDEVRTVYYGKNRTIASFAYEVQKRSNVEGKDVTYSPEYFINNAPWKLKITRDGARHHSFCASVNSYEEPKVVRIEIVLMMIEHMCEWRKSDNGQWVVTVNGELFKLGIGLYGVGRNKNGLEFVVSTGVVFQPETKVNVFVKY